MAIYPGVLGVLLVVLSLVGEVQEIPPELRSGSRTPYVHRLTLYNHDGEAINPQDVPAQPYSPRATCSKCHDYGSISGGWHFNANHPAIDPGRACEPWILTDPQTGTQLPLSYRGRLDTYRPHEVGLSDWAFVKAFGRHLPGGGPGEPDRPKIEGSRESLRWDISGQLEIDCMVCHSADAQHDAAEAADQIKKENFRWSPTAALGLAVIRGEARKVPDDFDPYAPPNPDFPEQEPPAVVYSQSRFDADDRVFFDITRRPEVERCYFCHTTRQVGPGSPARWEVAQDVHMAAGMICTDCHRNDIGHQITRGYEGEVEDHGEPAVPAVAVLSCEGCHLGFDDGDEPSPVLGGRLGAPRPQHPGIPPLHFEKLTCTACHCGPWPEEYPRRIQTSMAHGLGLPSKERRDDDPPLIVEPIFARQDDGKIAPHRMIWPALWGWMSPDGYVVTRDLFPSWLFPSRLIKPLSLDELQRLPGGSADPANGGEHAANLTSSIEIGVALSKLTESAPRELIPAYVRNGFVYTLTPDGDVKMSEHTEASPYLWPLAHDVRPAAQSLGVRGCTDCHALDAPFYFGRVCGESDGFGETPPVKFMYEMQGVDAALARAWATSIKVSPVYKWAGWFCALLVGAILVLFGFYGLGGLLRRFR